MSIMVLQVALNVPSEYLRERNPRIKRSSKIRHARPPLELSRHKDYTLTLSSYIRSDNIVRLWRFDKVPASLFSCVCRPDLAFSSFGEEFRRDIHRKIPTPPQLLIL